MLKTKWGWLVLAVVTVLAIGAAAMFMLASDGGASSAMPSETQTEPYRVIGEWEGYVAVFLPHTHTPETVYDTPLQALPAEERQKLLDGIEVSDEAALKKRLEDYLS